MAFNINDFILISQTPSATPAGSLTTNRIVTPDWCVGSLARKRYTMADISTLLDLHQPRQNDDLWYLPIRRQGN
jgi:hypothetical protein